MKHAALNLLGGFAGMTLGWLAVATPSAAVFAPTRLTWDATGCPAGIYSVTSTARNVGSGETFVATSTNVQLPRPTFIQEFTDLPAGTYSVSASVQGDSGAVFSARPQTIQSQASATANTGYRGPAVTAPSVTGTVRPRTRPGQPPSATQGAGTQATPAAPAAPPGVIPGPAIGSPERSLLEIRRLLDLTGQVDWRRIEVLDLDGDGIIDRAAIELATGDIYILMVRGRQSD